MVDAGLMKRPCGDAGMPAPCNPWGGDVGDDLSFAMPNSCLACRDDDPKKLSSAKVTTCLAQVGSCRGFVTADVLEKGLSRGAIATG